MWLEVFIFYWVCGALNVAVVVRCHLCPLWDALPTIVVLCGQGSRKSSVLESIRNFLPKGSGIATRRSLVCNFTRLSQYKKTMRSFFTLMKQTVHRYRIKMKLERNEDDGRTDNCEGTEGTYARVKTKELQVESYVESSVEHHEKEMIN